MFFKVYTLYVMSYNLIKKEIPSTKCTYMEKGPS